MFVFQSFEKLFFPFYCLVGFLKVSGHFFWRKEEVLELLLKNLIQIHNWDFVPALVTDIFGRIGRDIHFVTAGAKSNTREKMDGLFSRSLAVFGSLLKN